MYKDVLMLPKSSDGTKGFHVIYILTYSLQKGFGISLKTLTTPLLLFVRFCCVHVLIHGMN